VSKLRVRPKPLPYRVVELAGGSGRAEPSSLVNYRHEAGRPRVVRVNKLPPENRSRQSFVYNSVSFSCRMSSVVNCRVRSIANYRVLEFAVY